MCAPAGRRDRGRIHRTPDEGDRSWDQPRHRPTSGDALPRSGRRCWSRRCGRSTSPRWRRWHPSAIDGCVVEELPGKAGLHVDGGGEVPVPFVFATLDEAWTAHTSAGPLQKVIDIAGAPAVRAVMDAVLEADRKPDGTLRQDNVMRY